MTTGTTVQTALQMAMDCIQMSNGDTITDCTVTGYSQPGSSIIVKSGDQVNISTITVRTVVTIKDQRKVYVDHVMPVGRTFTNR